MTENCGSLGRYQSESRVLPSLPNIGSVLKRLGCLSPYVSLALITQIRGPDYWLKVPLIRDERPSTIQMRGK